MKIKSPREALFSIRPYVPLQLQWNQIFGLQWGCLGSGRGFQCSDVRCCVQGNRL